MTDRQAGPADEGGFLSRWSRRKAQAREGAAVPSETAPDALPGSSLAPTPTPSPSVARRPLPGEGGPGPAAAAPMARPVPAAGGGAPVAGQAAHAQADPPRPAAPTLSDVEQLTKDSDFRAFAARDVDPQVRNAAMKKLFHSDPHFNVMDGLDVYIDDYSQGEPLPRSIMRTMLQARALGLLDDELKEQDKPEPDPPADGPHPHEPPTPDEHPDLQLQPDDAAGHPAPPAGAERADDAPGEPVGRVDDADDAGGPERTG